MSSSETDVPQSEVYNAFSHLYDSLNDAYWAASTIEAKDRIAGVRDQVYEVTMDLVGQDIKSRTADFEAVSARVSDVNTRLKALSIDIGSLVARVSAVNAVVTDITQVLKLAKAFFV